MTLHNMPDTKPKILIVDDDTDLLELLAIRLTAAGYKTETVQSAEAALNHLAVSRPQLVISDMQMSGMDGMTLFEHIHRTLPTLPVIILTALWVIMLLRQSARDASFWDDATGTNLRA